MIQEPVADVAILIINWIMERKCPQISPVAIEAKLCILSGAENFLESQASLNVRKR